MTDDASRQAAAALMDDVAEEIISEQPAPEAAEPEVELPSWQADTTGLDFLEDEDDEPELPAAPVEEEEEVEPEWDEDPAATKLRKDLAKANKQLAWEREQRITSSRKNWRQEAERRFPLADVDSIRKADRRRATLKAAAAQQAKMEKKLGPILQRVDQLRGEVLTEARQEARAEAAQAWGAPSVGAPSGEQAQAVEDAAKYKPSAYKRLEDLTLAKLKGGVLDIG